MSDLLTKEILGEYLNYCPDTGEFRWKKTVGSRATSGSVCGSLTRQGYLTVRVNQIAILLHRAAWILMTGSYPKGVIDHVNGIKTDNSWGNLREATRSGNGTNLDVKDMTNIYILPSGKYNVKLKKNRKSISFGSYTDLELAQLVRDEARIKLFGEFNGRY